MGLEFREGWVVWYCKSLEGRMDGEVFVRDEGKVR